MSLAEFRKIIVRSFDTIGLVAQIPPNIHLRTTTPNDGWAVFFNLQKESEVSCLTLIYQKLLRALIEAKTLIAQFPPNRIQRSLTPNDGWDVCFNLQEEL